LTQTSFSPLKRTPTAQLDDEDDNKPIWPTWAVGAFFRGVRRIHIYRVYFQITSRHRLRSRDTLVKGSPSCLAKWDYIIVVNINLGCIFAAQSRSHLFGISFKVYSNAYNIYQCFISQLCVLCSLSNSMHFAYSNHVGRPLTNYVSVICH
jgi:hypothetical protein